MAIEYNFTLDMDRSKRDNNIAYARTGDVDSITINADLVLNGTAYTPTGTNAFFECVTPNGHSVRAAAQKSGSSVSVEVPSAAFQAAGVINVAYFRFESGEADNPTYVESTEPFAIVVREGIGDNIDAGDYIEEWRQLADQLEAIVAEVEQKAEQAETAINEQKTEVDQLKAQAQVAIAGDVTEVEEAAQSAIASINKEKADVADAAEDVSAAGEQAINTFNTNSQQAINQFKTNGTSAIDQFNTKADGKLDEVDGMITEAQGDVDAAITQLENETQNAIDAAHDALDGTTATNLQNAINRTLKLDVADMTNIPSNSSLSSFTNVGSYCCKTAAIAATVGDCPIDDSPFNMYVFSSATSGQVMQLVVPIDLNGKPTAEWHVRFGTSSAMDPWSVIGGGADISAGLGIDVTGDAQKTVALDTTAFYQHHEAASIIQGSTEVTGGGRIKELKVYGSTRQNLWVNPVDEAVLGIRIASSDDGSITVQGTTTGTGVVSSITVYDLKPSTRYTLSANHVSTYFQIAVQLNSNTISLTSIGGPYGSNVTFTTPATITSIKFLIWISSTTPVGTSISGTYRVMLNEGSEPEPWCPPGLNGVDELSIVTAGKNLLVQQETLPVALPYAMNGITFSDNGDGGIRISGTATDAAYYNFYATGAYPHLPPGTYTASTGLPVSGIQLSVGYLDPTSSYGYRTVHSVFIEPKTFKLDSPKTMRVFIRITRGTTVDTVMYPQIELGSKFTGFESFSASTTPVDLDGHSLNSLPDGTRDELRVDGTGAVTLVQRVGAFTLTDSTGFTYSSSSSSFLRIGFPDNGLVESGATNRLCNLLPVAGGNVDGYVNAFQVNEMYVSPGQSVRIKRSGLTTTEGLTSWLAGEPLVALYPFATPKEIDLGSMAMPDLASPDYTVFAESNVPAEIEAEVVKVDYLPPSDVYTKQEVDQKIEAASMPEIVPVSQGGTGVTTAAAERNRLGLGNTTGALPIANGGTGSTTAKASQYALLGAMEDVGTVPTDNSNFLLRYSSPSATQGVVFSCKASLVWSYIASKIRSTFGFNGSNVLKVSNGGTGGTSAKAAQNSLLNDMNASSDSLTDSSMLVGYNASPSATDGAVHKRSVTTVWDYIASKVADKVWDQIKTKVIRGDTDAGTDLTLTGGLESSSQTRTSTLTLGISEMSFDNSNAAPLTVNGEEVITEGNISSHLPATFDAKSVWFSTPLTQGQQKNIITEGGFTLEELRKYFVPGNLVLANMVCGGDHGVQLEKVVPMVITLGDGMVMQPTGITYDSATEAHYDCIFAVANNEQAGGSGSGLVDGVTMLYSVTEVPGYANRTSTSSLKGFTVFDIVSHAI